MGGVPAGPGALATVVSTVFGLLVDPSGPVATDLQRLSIAEADYATAGPESRFPVRALVAPGRRSLSGYLARSLVFAPFPAAWGLGLGVHLSSWSVALVAAYRMDRAGVRGPAETLLRRLTYRSASS